MRRSYLLNLITLAVLLLFCRSYGFSPDGPDARYRQDRRHQRTTNRGGRSDVDVYRTDMKADYHTKSDKKGDWIFAGLPLVGTYTVTISAPGASPMTRPESSSPRHPY